MGHSEIPAGPGRDAGGSASRAAGGAGAEPDAPILAGRYQLLGELGRGGMGTVHAALDIKLHRRVAIKLISVGHVPTGRL